MKKNLIFLFILLSLSHFVLTNPIPSETTTASSNDDCIISSSKPSTFFSLDLLEGEWFDLARTNFIYKQNTWHHGYAKFVFNRSHSFVDLNYTGLNNSLCENMVSNIRLDYSNETIHVATFTSEESNNGSLVILDRFHHDQLFLVAYCTKTLLNSSCSSLDHLDLFILSPKIISNLNVTHDDIYDVLRKRCVTNRDHIIINDHVEKCTDHHQITTSTTTTDATTTSVTTVDSTAASDDELILVVAEIKTTKAPSTPTPVSIATQETRVVVVTAENSTVRVEHLNDTNLNNTDLFQPSVIMTDEQSKSIDNDTFIAKETALEKDIVKKIESFTTYSSTLNTKSGSGSINIDLVVLKSDLKPNDTASNETLVINNSSTTIVADLNQTSSTNTTNESKSTIEVITVTTTTTKTTTATAVKTEMNHTIVALNHTTEPSNHTIESSNHTIESSNHTIEPSNHTIGSLNQTIVTLNHTLNATEQIEKPLLIIASGRMIAKEVLVDDEDSSSSVDVLDSTDDSINSTQSNATNVVLNKKLNADSSTLNSNKFEIISEKESESEEIDEAKNEEKIDDLLKELVNEQLTTSTTTTTTPEITVPLTTVIDENENESDEEHLSEESDEEEKLPAVESTTLEPSSTAHFVDDEEIEDESLEATTKSSSNVEAEQTTETATETTEAIDETTGLESEAIIEKTVVEDTTKQLATNTVETSNDESTSEEKLAVSVEVSTTAVEITKEVENDSEEKTLQSEEEKQSEETSKEVKEKEETTEKSSEQTSEEATSASTTFSTTTDSSTTEETTTPTTTTTTTSTTTTEETTTSTSTTTTTTESTTTPYPCLELNCSVTICLYGRKLDDNGCEMCDCLQNPNGTKDDCAETFCHPCFYGSVTDEFGCETCNCKPRPKPTSVYECPKLECDFCNYGSIKDEYGCETCLCIRPNSLERPYSCPPEPSCPYGTCKYGSVLNDFGCPTCDCMKETSSNEREECVKQRCSPCPHGYFTDADGCETCLCKPDWMAPCAASTSSQQCSEKCEHGSYLDRNGCPSCECLPNPDLISSCAEMSQMNNSTQCNTDGTFKPKQCNDKECRCVSKDGIPISGFKSPLNESDYMNCECAIALYDMSFFKAIGFKLFCSSNGNYETIQCVGSSCACVNEHGDPLGPSVPIYQKHLLRCEGVFQRVYYDQYLTTIAPTTLTPPLCVYHREKALDLSSIDPHLSIPECDEKGLYEPLQCDRQKKYCWCVNVHNGVELHGTRSTGKKPDCS